MKATLIIFILLAFLSSCSASKPTVKRYKASTSKTYKGKIKHNKQTMKVKNTWLHIKYIYAHGIIDHITMAHGTAFPPIKR